MKKIFILLVISFAACTQKESVQTKEQKEAKRSENLRIQALNEGDDFLYGSYLESARNAGINYEQLSVSLIMNHKFDNEQSNYQIYRCMIELNNNFKYETRKLGNLDAPDRLFAMSYLVKGAKKNNINCQAELEKIYRNGYGVEIDLKKSDSLYSLIEKNEGIGHFYVRHRQNKSKVDEIGG